MSYGEFLEKLNQLTEDQSLFESSNFNDERYAMLRLFLYNKFTMICSKGTQLLFILAPNTSTS